MPASRAAMGTEFVTTFSSRSDGRVGRDPAGRRPGVEQDAGPAEREELGRGRGDGVLVFGAGVLAFADAGFDEPQRPHGHGAAVHPAHQSRAVENGEVAPDGLGGDVVGFRELGHRGATLLDHQRGDRLLTLFGVHGAPSVWRSGPYEC